MRKIFTLASWQFLNIYLIILLFNLIKIDKNLIKTFSSQKFNIDFLSKIDF